MTEVNLSIRAVIDNPTKLARSAPLPNNNENHVFFDNPSVKGYLLQKYQCSTKFLEWDISVMSGLITGPNFIEYFHKPDALAVGTMVAVLEIGALSTFASRLGGFVQFAVPSDHSYLCLFRGSHIPRRRSRRRHYRQTNDALCRSCPVHVWWRNSDVFDGVRYDGRRTGDQWVWCGVVIVRVFFQTPFSFKMPTRIYLRALNHLGPLFPFIKAKFHLLITYVLSFSIFVDLNLMRRVSFG